MQETAKKNMQAYKGKWPPQKKCKPTRGKDPHRKNTKKCKHPTENAKWPKMQTKKCIYIFSPRPEMCVARCEVQRSRFISYVHVHFKPLNFIAVQPNTNQSFPKCCQHELKCTNKKKTLLSLSSGRTLSRSSQPFLQLRLKKGFDPTAVKNEHVKLCALQIYGCACLFFSVSPDTTSRCASKTAILIIMLFMLFSQYERSPLQQCWFKHKKPGSDSTVHQDIQTKQGSCVCL